MCGRFMPGRSAFDELCDGLSLMIRRMAVLSAVACSLVLAACSPTGSSPKAAPTPAVPSSPSSGPFDTYSTQIGAASVILYSCIGRFNGDQSQWCTGTQMSGLVKKVIAALKKDIGSRPDPSLFKDVSAAIASVEKSAGAVRQPCDNVSTNGLNCLTAFDKMMPDWYELQRATGYS
jgi:hypothetical protein